MFWLRFFAVLSQPGKNKETFSSALNFHPWPPRMLRVIRSGFRNTKMTHTRLPLAQFQNAEHPVLGSSNDTFTKIQDSHRDSNPRTANDQKPLVLFTHIPFP